MPIMSRSGRRIPWLGLIFGFVALVLLIVGTSLGANTVTFLNTTTVTTGTVVDSEQRTSCSRSTRDRIETCSTSDYPVITFTTATGEEVTFTSSTGSSPPLHRIGDTVQVRYPPDRPSAAAIDGFVELWLGALITTGLGIIIGGIATGMLLSHRRRTREEAAAPDLTEPDL